MEVFYEGLSCSVEKNYIFHFSFKRLTFRVDNCNLSYFFFQVQQLANGLLDIKKDIENCKKSPKSAVCLAKLVIKIDEEKERLPKEIARDIEFVINLIKNTLPILEKCGRNAVEMCEGIGKELLTKISICVARKIIFK